MGEEVSHCLLSTMQVQEGKQAQYDAFYRLSNTEQQITSYVFDVSLPCNRLRLYIIFI